QGHLAVEAAESFADGMLSEAERRAADVELWQASQQRHTTTRDWLARLTLVDRVDLWPAAREPSAPTLLLPGGRPPSCATSSGSRRAVPLMPRQSCLPEPPPP